MSLLTISSGILLAAVVMWLFWPALDRVREHPEANVDAEPDPEVLNTFKAMACRTAPKDCLAEFVRQKHMGKLDRAA